MLQTAVEQCTRPYAPDSRSTPLLLSAATHPDSALIPSITDDFILPAPYSANLRPEEFSLKNGSIGADLYAKKHVFSHI